MTDPAALSQSPFTILTFIAAPAVLTNASSVLALSTTNRMLRTRDLMKEMVAHSAVGDLEPGETKRLVAQVGRIEVQAGLLLKALHAIYVALGSFSGATLLTLVGAALAPFGLAGGSNTMAFLGLTLGACGVGSLIIGSMRLYRATQISLQNIHEEAELIRSRAAHFREVVGAEAPADLPDDGTL
jgi:hypothetical protein